MTRPRSSYNKDKERQAFSQRLGEMLARTGRPASPTRLAAEFNRHFQGPKIHMHSCRKWLHAESIPTQEKLVVLAHMLGVSPDWLRYGDSGHVAREPNLGPYAGDPQNLALLSSIRQLPERDRQVVRRLVEVMLSQR